MQIELETLLEESGLVLTVTQQQQLQQLVQLLHKWNKAYNLTSVRDPREMLVKHIMDSLVVSPFLRGQSFIDVGTGPGFPGLPLAIANPDKSFVLLDSLGKRIRFIRQAVHALGLANVTAVQARVEDYQPDCMFDAVLSRAFAALTDMLLWCDHLTGKHGCFLAMKGVVPASELAALPDKYKLDAIQPLRVPRLNAERHLIILRKL